MLLDLFIYLSRFFLVIAGLSPHGQVTSIGYFGLLNPKNVPIPYEKEFSEHG
jgi:hypothetical protein